MSDVDRVLDTLVKGSVMAMTAQTVVAQTAVKAAVPKVDGEQAKIGVLMAALEIVLAGVQLIEAVQDDAADAKIVEITASFNERMMKLDKLLQGFLEMSDVEYETKIPEERRKSLLSASDEEAREDGIMAEYSKYYKQMMMRQAKTKEATEIVEPIPGVLMLREKKFGNVPMPEVRYIET